MCQAYTLRPCAPGVPRAYTVSEFAWIVFLCNKGSSRAPFLAVQLPKSRGGLGSGLTCWRFCRVSCGDHCFLVRKSRRIKRGKLRICGELSFVPSSERARAAQEGRTEMRSPGESWSGRSRSSAETRTAENHESPMKYSTASLSLLTEPLSDDVVR